MLKPTCLLLVGSAALGRLPLRRPLGWCRRRSRRPSATRGAGAWSAHADAIQSRQQAVREHRRSGVFFRDEERYWPAWSSLPGDSPADAWGRRCRFPEKRRSRPVSGAGGGLRSCIERMSPGVLRALRHTGASCKNNRSCEHPWRLSRPSSATCPSAWKNGWAPVRREARRVDHHDRRVKMDESPGRGESSHAERIDGARPGAGRRGTSVVHKSQADGPASAGLITD